MDIGREEMIFFGRHQDNPVLVPSMFYGVVKSLLSLSSRRVGTRNL